MSQLLRMKKVAEHLDVGLMTAYRLVWAGEIPWVNVGAKKARRPSIRVSEAALVEYEQRQRRAGAT